MPLDHSKEKNRLDLYVRALSEHKILGEGEKLRTTMGVKWAKAPP